MGARNTNRRKTASATIAPPQSRLVGDNPTETVELQQAISNWEHKAAELAEECRKFLDLREKCGKAERGSDRYFALSAEMSSIATMFQAKGQSLHEIEEDVIDALPDDD